MKLYRELAEWWPLVSPAEEYVEEAGIYAAAIERLARRPVRTLLELGCGGGSNATHLRARYALTLTDLSPHMVAVSQRQNPGVEHHVADMRTLRLGRLFDAVLAHDAIAYMTTREDLALAVRTAALHLEPGGVALFVPDDTTETYVPETDCGGSDGTDRALRYLEWSLPGPGPTVRTIYAFVLADASGVRVELDPHETGLFPRATWLEVIREAGLSPETAAYDHSDFEPGHGHELFAGLRPA